MSADGFLHKYFLNNAHQPVHKWLHFFDVYERHFERFRDKSPVVLEIGVGEGGSLAMWKAYFGEGARIVGIDIDPAKCRRAEAPGIEVFCGSQDDPGVVARLTQKYPVIDIVIDDGSHQMPHLIASFELIYPHLSPQGVYLVEDLHTCYWPEYGGALHKPDTFIEYAKARIDDLNACHTRGALAVGDFSRSTDSVTFYDSIAVFERRPQGRRKDIVTQGM